MYIMMYIHVILYIVPTEQQFVIMYVMHFYNILPRIYYGYAKAIHIKYLQ